MKTQSTRYVVQYKSVYEAVSTNWQDYEQYVSIEEAQRHADGLRCVNPQVRVLSRQITETECPNNDYTTGAFPDCHFNP